MTVINGSVEHNAITGVYDIKIDLTDFLNSLNSNNTGTGALGGAGTALGVGSSNSIDYSKFSYSGDLEFEPYKEILAFKDGKVYFSYDGFSYFLVMGIVGIFLFKTFIKLCKEFFLLSFNLFKVGKK